MSLPRGAHISPRCLFFLVILGIACDSGTGPPRVSVPVCGGLDDYLRVAAVGRPPGVTHDAAVSGTAMFSISVTEGLSVLDFSDPSNVRVAGGLPSLTDAQAIESAGSWLVTANGDRGLAIVNVSNPYSPVIAKTIPMPGACVDVRAIDDRAYVANDALGLVIVDMSNPASASVLGIENTPGNAAGVVAVGPLAFVIHQPSQLRVVNVLNPAAPFIIESIDIPGFTEGIDARDGVVAVAAGQAGCQLVDVSSPSSPVLAGVANTPVDAVAVALVDGIAFVADKNGGVPMYDISDISNPVARGTLGTVSYSYNVAVSDGRLVTADDQAGVRVFEIDPPAPAPFDSLIANGNVVDVANFGDLVLAADATAGLWVIDPATRAVIGGIPVGSAPREIAVVDSVAYVARANNNIAIVDLRDPRTPVLTGSFGLGNDYDHLAIAGDFGYLIDENGWLYEERISSPESGRVFRDTFVLWTSITADAGGLLGPVLYVPNARGTVLVIPTFRMTPISDLPVAGSPQRVVIRRDGPPGPGATVLAYVAETGFNTGQAGVEIFDVTDVNAPVLMGSFACAGNASDIAFAGSRILIGEADDGAEVFDLLGNGRARPAGMLVAPAYRVVVSNGTAVAAGRRSGALFLSLDDCLP